MKPTDIKKIRLSVGLSVAAAARQVEVNPRTWARWEAGDREMPRGAIKLFYMLNDLGEPPIK